MSVKGGTVSHCSGKNKGKAIKTYKGKGAHAKALRMHRAIQASKHPQHKRSGN